MKKRGLLLLGLIFSFALALVAVACGDEVELCDDHTFGEWVTVTESTCLREGEKKRICSVCQAEETDKIPLSGHTYGDWTQAKAGNCLEQGEEERECSVCHNSKQTRKTPIGDHEWSPWAVTSAPSCIDKGLQTRTCFVCREKDTRELPVDSTAHRYGAWNSVSEPDCLNAGKKTRTCIDCSHVDEQEIPASGDHNFVQTRVITPSTCSQKGVREMKCSGCGTTREEEMPLDLYAHGATGAGGMCADCHGLLSQSVVVDNSAGKAIDFYSKYYEGDFKAVYTFHNNSGVDGCWDNYIFIVGPAEYLGGTFTRTGVSEYNILPFYPNPLEQYYAEGYKLWQQLGNRYETTWFYNAAGDELDFATCMQRGADVVATFERRGAILTITLENTVDLGTEKVTCTVNAELNYPGAERLFIGLTGEDNTVELQQVQLLQGDFASETTPTKLNSADETYDNVGQLAADKFKKNEQGRNDTFKGDFSVEYRFAISNPSGSDWHSWILYLTRGIPKSYDLATMRARGDLYWSCIGNGAEPEQPGNGSDTIVYHNLDFLYFLRKTTDDATFARKISSCSVILRVSKVNGYLSVLGTATATGESEPFAYWTFYSMDNRIGDVATVRLTSENSTVVMKEVLLYNGVMLTAEGECAGEHDFGAWTVTKEAVCGEAGEKEHVCSVCGKSETEAIPAPGEHSYGAWNTVKEPQCGTAGEKEHTCSVCGHKETETIPAGGEHSYGEWIVETEANCQHDGLRKKTCSLCGDEAEEVLPLDPYTHSAVGANGVCADCHGILTEEKTLDNGTGKNINAYGNYFSGEFKAVYTFDTTCGPEPDWDSFLFVAGPAEYVNGKLVRTQVGEMSVIPFIMTVENQNILYGPLWKENGNTYQTSWFHNEDNAEGSYQSCMAQGGRVVLTVEKTGYCLNVTMVVTVEMNEMTYTMTNNVALNFNGVEHLYIGITGEDSVQTLKQVQVFKGDFAPSAKAEESASVPVSTATIDNTGVKNQAGLSYLFKGDFDAEYKFKMNGNPNEAWHSWILYFLNGRSEAMSDLYWSTVAYGCEPEQSALYHHNDFGFYRFAGAGAFAEKLASADVTLRVTRRNGYITVFGTGTPAGESEPSIFWSFFSIEKKTGELTLRLTTENSVLQVQEIRLYSGTAFRLNGECAGEHSYGEWSVTKEAVCGEAGEQEHVCSVCGKSETEAIPAPGTHDYGEWNTVKEPLCGTAGTKERVCSICGHKETGEIPAIGTHSFGDWSVARKSTCSVYGKEKRTCSLCGEAEERDLTALDIYDHTAMGADGVCADCHGLLSQELTVNNTAGKGIDFYSKYYEGDFKAVYTFRNNSGSDGNWHNYFFVLGPAEYLNGQLVRTGISEYNILSFYPNPLEQYYGAEGYKMWTTLGNTYETTWFRDEAGNEVGFGECMQLGAEVTATIERVGTRVTVTLVNTVEKDGGICTCRVVAKLNYPGAERIFVGLTGESSSVQLKQVTVVGDFASETTPVKLNDAQETYASLDGAKNVQGRNDSFNGDFSVEYRFHVANTSQSDWHSWILYTLKGVPEEYSVDGLRSRNELYWSCIANGAEPEQGGPLYHGMDFLYFLRKTTDDATFAQKLSSCSVALRVSKVNGYISVLGTAVSDGDDAPFAYWTFYSMDDTSGDTVTLRMTSENSTIVMDEVLLYAGERV